MRICLHTYYEISNPYIGGTQTLLIKLAKELKVLGHEAFIVCSSLCSHNMIEGVDVYGIIPQKYVNVLRQEYDGIPSSRFLKGALFMGKDLATALTDLGEYSYEQYSKFQADIYHINSYVSLLSADKLQKPVVAYHHENEMEFDSFWGPGAFNELIIKLKCLQSKSVLFTASRYYANHFSILLQKSIQAVHLGVPLNDMAYSKAVTFTEKTRFERNEDSVVILVPSRFNVQQKGQDLAITACEKLLKKYNIELVFSGIKASLFDELKTFRQKYQTFRITEKTHFIAIENMYHLYESVHIVLSPERYCSYGLSISEALSIGIPTVLSDIPTYSEIASGYNHAVFFKKDDLDDLISKLDTVLSTASQYNYRDNESAIEFRINNDLRYTAATFSKIYKNLNKQ